MTTDRTADRQCCMGWPLGDEHRCLNECSDEDMARAWPDGLWCSTCFNALYNGGLRCECDNCERPYNEATA